MRQDIWLRKLKKLSDRKSLTKELKKITYQVNKAIGRQDYSVKAWLSQGELDAYYRTIEDLVLDWSLTNEESVSDCFERPKSQRKFHAYCVGLPRSGTHSIAYALGSYYRSSHEPSPKGTIEFILKYCQGEISQELTKKIIHTRDNCFNLDLESAHYLSHCIDLLTECFPESKYIFSIREPYEWLNSEINKNLETSSYFWSKLQNFRYGNY